MMWIVYELLFTGGLIGIDLLSKWAIKAFLLNTPLMHYAIFDGVLELHYVENYGASFGLFSGNQILLLVITCIVVAAMIVILVLRPKAPKLFRYGLLTIVGGAIGNIFDRAVLGYVRDFIDYTFLHTWFGIDFAIGNIADIFCLIGLLMLIVYILFQYKDGDFAGKKRLKDANT